MLRRTWLTAGTTLAVLSKISRFLIEKLETLSKTQSARRW